ncbi:MaoC family dehydratase N-terminal domain-containing protein [Phytohabitans sp. ZYX-F-186]|uniref:MaoC family dehydratase N-terminal domain-containing protein n=1 Tax=Phytohabitans maris TaxID=3071409 RepID=A0ABU0Z9N6_9ACTN|nr:MaoC family dehydratase N-terminal domain-containing protein [Phytohabitans sp. ZYX-F-186]MDQ7903753.1 MaoC family dehydratase N-terminal domain-containing protein [Phytohabitans sp. ZYX-F-186]
MVDTGALGAAGTPFEMEIERGKVREFARAVFATDPAYLSDVEPVIPPTFLTTAFFWQHGDSDPWEKVAMDQSRGLHAEQEYVFHGPPPRAGDRLTAQSAVTEIYTKTSRGGGTLTFAVMVTEFRDASGRLVAEARQTGVETS